MKVIITLAGILFCILLACTDAAQLKLSDDPVIIAVFDEIEIESLEKILLFFRDAVISSSDQNTTDFAKSMDLAGGIMPHNLGNMIYKHENFDLESDRIQLLIFLQEFLPY